MLGLTVLAGVGAAQCRGGGVPVRAHDHEALVRTGAISRGRELQQQQKQQYRGLLQRREVQRLTAASNYDPVGNGRGTVTSNRRRKSKFDRRFGLVQIPVNSSSKSSRLSGCRRLSDQPLFLNNWFGSKLETVTSKCIKSSLSWLTSACSFSTVRKQL